MKEREEGRLLHVLDRDGLISYEKGKSETPMGNLGNIEL